MWRFGLAGQRSDGRLSFARGQDRCRRKLQDVRIFINCLETKLIQFLAPSGICRRMWIAKSAQDVLVSLLALRLR